LCSIALLPPIFLLVVRFCTPFFFLSDFAPYLLPLSPSFNDDFEQNTIGKRWGAKSLIKKEGVQNRTISKR